MNAETWFSFLIAYTIISAIPGPSVAMILSQSFSRGIGAALFCIVGELLGGIVVMTVSFAGLGAVLATSSLLFFLLKWLGVLYLAYLGVKQILAARRVFATELTIEITNESKSEELSATVPEYRWASVRAGFFTGILNPKAIMFYVAFLTQFIDHNQSVLPQLVVLMITSSVIVATVLAAYAILATRLKDSIQSASAQRRFGYFGGSFLLGGSAFLAMR